VSAGGDRAGDDALAFLVALHLRAQLLDDPHRLVTDDQSLADGILAAKDVNIGAADRGRRDAQQRIQGSDVGHRSRFQDDASRFGKDGRHHPGHDVPPRFMRDDRLRPVAAG
jgi:hypothetical protein